MNYKKSNNKLQKVIDKLSEEDLKVLDEMYHKELKFSVDAIFDHLHGETIMMYHGCDSIDKYIRDKFNNL